MRARSLGGNSGRLPTWLNATHETRESIFLVESCLRDSCRGGECHLPRPIALDNPSFVLFFLLIAMASHLRAMASNLLAKVSNLKRFFLASLSLCCVDCYFLVRLFNRLFHPPWFGPFFHLQFLCVGKHSVELLQGVETCPLLSSFVVGSSCMRLSTQFLAMCQETSPTSEMAEIEVTIPEDSKPGDVLTLDVNGKELEVTQSHNTCPCLAP